MTINDLISELQRAPGEFRCKHIRRIEGDADKATPPIGLNIMLEYKLDEKGIKYDTPDDAALVLEFY